MAEKIGYTPLLADAQNLPFISGFADIVAVNATLHHCDDMSKALVESARLVRTGGFLVIDHDPQLTAWDYKGLAMFFYRTHSVS
jgi:ubiquinone/menaquinone biosynthesis C-methylase UbiE